MTLRQRQIMHMRRTGEAVYCYEITDGDKVVGTKSVRLNKRTRPWTETATYVLLESEGAQFTNAKDFVAAYEAKLKKDGGENDATS